MHHNVPQTSTTNSIIPPASHEQLFTASSNSHQPVDVIPVYTFDNLQTTHPLETNINTNIPDFQYQQSFEHSNLSHGIRLQAPPENINHDFQSQQPRPQAPPPNYQQYSVQQLAYEYNQYLSQIKQEWTPLVQLFRGLPENISHIAMGIAPNPTLHILPILRILHSLRHHLHLINTPEPNVASFLAVLQTRLLPMFLHISHGCTSLFAILSILHNQPLMLHRIVDLPPYDIANLLLHYRFENPTFWSSLPGIDTMLESSFCNDIIRYCHYYTHKTRPQQHTLQSFVHSSQQQAPPLPEIQNSMSSNPSFTAIVAAQTLWLNQPLSEPNGRRHLTFDDLSSTAPHTPRRFIPQSPPSSPLHFNSLDSTLSTAPTPTTSQNNKLSPNGTSPSTNIPIAAAAIAPSSSSPSQLGESTTFPHSSTTTKITSSTTFRDPTNNNPHVTATPCLQQESNPSMLQSIAMVSPPGALLPYCSVTQDITPRLVRLWGEQLWEVLSHIWHIVLQLINFELHFTNEPAIWDCISELFPEFFVTFEANRYTPISSVLEKHHTIPLLVFFVSYSQHQGFLFSCCLLLDILCLISPQNTHQLLFAHPASPSIFSVLYTSSVRFPIHMPIIILDEIRFLYGDSTHEHPYCHYSPWRFLPLPTKAPNTTRSITTTDHSNLFNMGFISRHVISVFKSMWQYFHNNPDVLMNYPMSSLLRAIRHFFSDLFAVLSIAWSSFCFYYTTYFRFHCLNDQPQLIFPLCPHTRHMPPVSQKMHKFKYISSTTQSQSSTSSLSQKQPQYQSTTVRLHAGTFFHHFFNQAVVQQLKSLFGEYIETLTSLILSVGPLLQSNEPLFNCIAVLLNSSQLYTLVYAGLLMFHLDECVLNLFNAMLHLPFVWLVHNFVPTVMPFLEYLMSNLTIDESSVKTAQHVAQFLQALMHVPLRIDHQNPSLDFHLFDFPMTQQNMNKISPTLPSAVSSPIDKLSTNVSNISNFRPDSPSLQSLLLNRIHCDQSDSSLRVSLEVNFLRCNPALPDLDLDLRQFLHSMDLPISDDARFQSVTKQFNALFDTTAASRVSQIDSMYNTTSLSLFDGSVSSWNNQTSTISPSTTILTPSSSSSSSSSSPATTIHPIDAIVSHVDTMSQSQPKDTSSVFPEFSVSQPLISSPLPSHTLPTDETSSTSVSKHHITPVPRLKPISLSLYPQYLSALFQQVSISNYINFQSCFFPLIHSTLFASMSYAALIRLVALGLRYRECIIPFESFFPEYSFLNKNQKHLLLDFFTQRPVIAAHIFPLHTKTFLSELLSSHGLETHSFSQRESQLFTDVPRHICHPSFWGQDDHRCPPPSLFKSSTAQSAASTHSFHATRTLPASMCSCYPNTAAQHANATPICNALHQNGPIASDNLFIPRLVTAPLITSRVKRCVPQIDKLSKFFPFSPHHISMMLQVLSASDLEDVSPIFHTIFESLSVPSPAQCNELVPHSMEEKLAFSKQTICLDFSLVVSAIWFGTGRLDRPPSLITAPWSQLPLRQLLQQLPRRHRLYALQRLVGGDETTSFIATILHNWTEQHWLQRYHHEDDSENEEEDEDDDDLEDQDDLEVENQDDLEDGHDDANNPQINQDNDITDNSNSDTALHKSFSNQFWSYSTHQNSCVRFFAFPYCSIASPFSPSFLPETIFQDDGVVISSHHLHHENQTSNQIHPLPFPSPHRSHQPQPHQHTSSTSSTIPYPLPDPQDAALIPRDVDLDMRIFSLLSRGSTMQQELDNLVTQMCQPINALWNVCFAPRIAIPRADLVPEAIPLLQEHAHSSKFHADSHYLVPLADSYHFRRSAPTSDLAMKNEANLHIHDAFDSPLYSPYIRRPIVAFFCNSLLCSIHAFLGRDVIESDIFLGYSRMRPDNLSLHSHRMIPNSLLDMFIRGTIDIPSVECDPYEMYNTSLSIQTTERCIAQRFQQKLMIATNDNGCSSYQDISTDYHPDQKYIDSAKLNPTNNPIPSHFPPPASINMDNKSSIPVCCDILHLLFQHGIEVFIMLLLNPDYFAIIQTFEFSLMRSAPAACLSSLNTPIPFNPILKRRYIGSSFPQHTLIHNHDGYPTVDFNVITALSTNISHPSFNRSTGKAQHFETFRSNHNQQSFFVQIPPHKNNNTTNDPQCASPPFETPESDNNNPNVDCPPYPSSTLSCELDGIAVPLVDIVDLNHVLPDSGGPDPDMASSSYPSLKTRETLSAAGIQPTPRHSFALSSVPFAIQGFFYGFFVALPNIELIAFKRFFSPYLLQRSDSDSKSFVRYIPGIAFPSNTKVFLRSELPCAIRRCDTVPDMFWRINIDYLSRLLNGRFDEVDLLTGVPLLGQQISDSTFSSCPF